MFIRARSFYSEVNICFSRKEIYCSPELFNGILVPSIEIHTSLPSSVGIKYIPLSEISSELDAVFNILVLEEAILPFFIISINLPPH
jgi:hypothetical protein